MRGNWTSMAFSKGTPCTWQTHRHVMGEGWLGSPWSEMKALVRNFVCNPENKHGLFRFSIRVKCPSLCCFSLFCECMPPALPADERTSIWISWRLAFCTSGSTSQTPYSELLCCAKYTNLIQSTKLDCCHHWFQRSLKFHFSWAFSVQKPLSQLLKTSCSLMDSS